MPTCISVDNCVCHFSPFKSKPPVLLKEGQVIKIDLGALVDGYFATAAHTIVVGASKENKVTGKKANAIVSRLQHNGNGAAEAQPRQAVQECGHQLPHQKIDSNREYALASARKVQDCWRETNYPKSWRGAKVQDGEVLLLRGFYEDILISTGEGKPKPIEAHTTIFKKVDMVYHLKLKASPALFHEAQQKFESMPFSLRHFEDEKVAKVGSNECAKHDLMQSYQVLYEREGEFVAHSKYTAIIMPTGIYKIAGLPLDHGKLKCEVYNPEISALLGESLKPKKNGAKKVKKRSSSRKPRSRRSGPKLLGMEQQHNVGDNDQKRCFGHMRVCLDWAEFIPLLDKKMLLLPPFCGRPKCETLIKDQSVREEPADQHSTSQMGAKTLCIPLEQPKEPALPDRCIHPSCTEKD